MPAGKIDPRTEIGAVRLTVRNLPELTGFYLNAIGLSRLDEGTGFTTLGVGDRPLLHLTSKPDGINSPTTAGLFHFAILLPDRPQLGQWLVHFLEKGFRLDGVGDHLVSEALYLSDPEGNGIEMYRDRPRETWDYQNGQIKMDTLAVDLESMVEEADSQPFTGLPDGTKMGHIHLQVHNVAETSAFYQDILGFDVMAQMPGAGFLSAGGYHHHIGMNTWRSYGGGFAPPNALGLRDYEIILPDQTAKEQLVMNLNENHLAFEQENGCLRVQDPAGIWIRFVTQT